MESFGSELAGRSRYLDIKTPFMTLQAFSSKTLFLLEKIEKQYS